MRGQNASRRPRLSHRRPCAGRGPENVCKNNKFVVLSSAALGSRLRGNDGRRCGNDGRRCADDAQRNAVLVSVRGWQKPPSTGGRLPPLREMATTFVKTKVGAATCRPCSQQRGGIYPSVYAGQPVGCARRESLAPSPPPSGGRCHAPSTTQWVARLFFGGGNGSWSE